MTQKQASYSIDLAALQATCEANYLRLLCLIPAYETNNYREFSLVGRQRVRIDVVQRCRYTTILKIQQFGGGAWLAALRFEVRVYHDVRMAEVISFQTQRRSAARYDYPNPDMHSRDEKSQQNLFLAEWLGHCLEQGCSEEVLNLPGAAGGP